MIAWVMSAVLAIVAPGRAVDSRAACALLSDDEIRAVQGSAIAERKDSVAAVGSLAAAQCVFAASEFAKSISLTVMTGDTRTYWETTFHTRPPAANPSGRAPRLGKKGSPRPVTGPGEEAFWTGDDRAGSLYVLSAERILRISVGGVLDEAERIRRSQVLAAYALGRMR
jgi:hypothetical protein